MNEPLAYEELFEQYELYGSFIYFSLDLRIENKEVNVLIENLLQSLPLSNKAKGKTKVQSRMYLNSIIANLSLAYIMKKCVAIPRSSAYFNGNTCLSDSKISKVTFLAILNFLAEMGFVGVKKGFSYSSSESGKVSRYWAKNNLLLLIAKVKNSEICNTKTGDVVILHGQNKKEIDFEENKISKYYREKLIEINGSYNKFRFKYVKYEYTDKVINTYYTNSQLYNKSYSSSLLGRNEDGVEEALYPRLCTVFSRADFSCGGRLYSIPQKGVGWQNISKQERASITINDEPICELDFSSLHISMLYAIQGMQLKDDPYIGFDAKYRPIYKTVILTLLNAKSVSSTAAAMRETIRELETKQLISERNHNFLRLAKELNPNWKTLIEEFSYKHSVIKGYFGSDCGILLQRLDSELMLGIVHRLVCMGIPALPVHDSVIVPVTCVETARKIMDEEYKRKFGFECKIK